MVKKGVVIYVIIMSIIGFIQMGLDKSRAKHSRYRIPERTLFLTAFAGGSFGSLIGMYAFRHKTRHLQFVIGIPVIVVFHIFLLYLVLFFLK